METKTAVKPKQPMMENGPYLEKFEQFEKGAKDPAWVRVARKAGISHFVELGFPTLQDEDWRFTNVAPIAKLPFEPVFEPTRDAVAAKALNQFTFAGLSGSRTRLCERPLRAGAFLSCQAAGRREGDEPCGRARERHRARRKTPCPPRPRRYQRLHRVEHRVLPGRRVHLRAGGQDRAGANPASLRLHREGERRAPPMCALSSWPSPAVMRP